MWFAVEFQAAGKRSAMTIASPAGSATCAATHSRHCAKGSATVPSLLHALAKTIASFDDPHIVSHADL